MAAQRVSQGNEFRWLPLLLSLGSLGLFVSIVSFVVYWARISPWLTSNDSSLTGLGAIATGLAALIAAVGLFVGGIGAFAVRNQVELQRKISQQQSSRECLWRFTGQWKDEILKVGSDGKHHWTRALEALDSESWKHPVVPDGFIGEKDSEVVEVLNFFESIAFMWSRGDLDLELSWNDFSDTALTLYPRSRAFVKAYRQGLIKRQPDDKTPGDSDHSFWENFDPWAEELRKYDELRKELRKQGSP